jgi:hypothetical protein
MRSNNEKNVSNASMCPGKGETGCVSPTCLALEVRDVGSMLVSAHVINPVLEVLPAQRFVTGRG